MDATESLIEKKNNIVYDHFIILYFYSSIMSGLNWILKNTTLTAEDCPHFH